MRRNRLCILAVLVIGNALIATLLVSAAAPAQATGAIHHVAPGGSCGGPSPCYSTIQAAVDAAGSGDEIRVAGGVHTDLHVRPRLDVTATGWVTQVVYVNKTIAIRGGYATTNWSTPDPSNNLTTVDALGQGRGLYLTGNISTTIEGLRITNGNASQLGGMVRGDGASLDVGGVSMRSPPPSRFSIARLLAIQSPTTSVPRPSAGSAADCSFAAQRPRFPAI